MGAGTIKIHSTLLDAARDEAALQDRSISGQVSHWMKIGRAIERSGSFSYDHIREALVGARSPDELTGDEQIVWFALSDEDINTPNSDVDDAFAALGDVQGASGYDEDGKLIQRS